MACECCELKYTSKLRYPIKCYYCNFTSCSKCVEKFLINFSNGINQCMNCKKIWSYTFMMDNLTKTFMNKTYRLFKIDILYKRETQTVIPSNFINKYSFRQYIRKHDEETQEKLIKKFTNTIFEKIEKPIIKKEKEIKLISNCFDEKCLGKIYNNDYSCNVCNRKICKKCMKYKEDKHICLKEDIENIEFIKSSSTKCPSCGVNITKSSGCNDMLCMNCGTGFNYVTGKIIQGTFHNPHRVEFLAKHNIQSIETCNNGTINMHNFKEDEYYYYYLLVNQILTKIHEINSNLKDYIANSGNKFMKMKAKLQFDMMFSDILKTSIDKITQKYKEKIYKVDLYINKSREFIDLFNMIELTLTDLILLKKREEIVSFVDLADKLIVEYNKKYNRIFKTLREIALDECKMHDIFKLLHELYVQKKIKINYIKLIDENYRFENISLMDLLFECSKNYNFKNIIPFYEYKFVSYIKNNDYSKFFKNIDNNSFNYKGNKFYFSFRSDGKIIKIGYDYSSMLYEYKICNSNLYQLQFLSE